VSPRDKKYGNLFTGTVREGNVPLVVNLRQEPFERYPVEAAGYARWWVEKLWPLIQAGAAGSGS